MPRGRLHQFIQFYSINFYEDIVSVPPRLGWRSGDYDTIRVINEEKLGEKMEL